MERNLRKERVGLVIGDQDAEEYYCSCGKKSEAPYVWEVCSKDD